MIIKIDKDALLEGLQKVFNIVPQKPTLPMLSNYLLSVQSGRIFISGTDMDISITTSVACNVVEEGSSTVNAKKFLGIIRELPSEEISISVENDKITVDYSKGKTSIIGMTSADYPSLKDNLEGNEISFSSDDFVEMADKTSFSAAKDRTRLVLTGIYWKISLDEMVMVSTDGHRLSLFGRKIDVDTTNKPAESEIIIPPATLNTASQIIAGGENIDKIVFGEKAVLFKIGETVIYSKLLEGPYPNFRQVIPQNNSKKVIVSVTELEAAVRRVSVISSSITHMIKMRISSGLMEISTINEDIGGESRESIAVRYDGDTMIAGYNGQFLSEILKRIDTEDVLIEMESPTTACLLKPVGLKDSDEYIYLIMPLRLSD